MKTKTFLKAGLIAAFVLCVQVSFAQIIELPTVVITAKSLVSAKVTDAFKGTFQNAVNPRWYKADKNYLVKFIMEDQKNSALYKKEGTLIYHLSYGVSKDLPKDYLDMVNTEYPGCTVVTAVHVEQNKRSIWFVNVEYKKDYILTKIEDNQLGEVSRTKNASAK